MSRSTYINTIVTVATFTAAATAADVHVPGDFATIQQAIDAADNGDVIIVAPGTYTGNITLLGKDITLESSAGAEKTIIQDTDWTPTIACVSGEVASTVIKGFTITGIGLGVQVEDADPTFTECIIEANELHGVLITSGNPTFTHCTIRDNLSWDIGGGVSVTGGDVTFEHCQISDNVVGTDSYASGGGLGVTNATVSLVNCIISNNVADSQSSGGQSVSRGGGVWVSTSGFVTLTGCILENNVTNPGYGSDTTTSHGGAIFGDNLLIMDSEFVNNRALSPEIVAIGFGQTIPRGGAIYGSPTIEDSTFRNNAAIAPFGWDESYGGAIFGSPIASATTFCGNAPEHISGNWINEGGNVFSTYCPVGDLDGDGVVDVSDLLTQLSQWGACKGGDTCPGDFNGDGSVDVTDLLVLLSNWS